MTTVTVSPKSQVVIPLAVRQRLQLQLQPGAKRQVIEFKGGLRLMPLTPPSALRGIARGIDTQITRDDDQPL